MAVPMDMDGHGKNGSRIVVALTSFLLPKPTIIYAVSKKINFVIILSVKQVYTSVEWNIAKQKLRPIYYLFFYFIAFYMRTEIPILFKLKHVWCDLENKLFLQWIFPGNEYEIPFWVYVRLRRRHVYNYSLSIFVQQSLQ